MSLIPSERKTFMPTEREKQLKTIVNASGFIFQLSIMSNVQRTEEKHNWEIFAHEHPWRDHISGDEGYIDLILKKNRDRLIIECKRTKDASWIFLSPDNEHDELSNVKCMWSDIYENPNKLILNEEGEISGRLYDIVSGWNDFQVAPRSPQSEFCAIRGTGENDKPLLERICGQLLKAIECLSIEEMEIAKKKKYPDACIYIPIIITNAQLELCHFDPEKISLSDGLLKDGKFETVPFIRFRKSLTTVLSSNLNPYDLFHANKEKERTILIINANFLCEILENIQVKLPALTEEWPWHSKFYRRP